MIRPNVGHASPAASQAAAVEALFQTKIASATDPKARLAAGVQSILFLGDKEIFDALFKRIQRARDAEGLDPDVAACELWLMADREFADVDPDDAEWRRISAAITAVEQSHGIFDLDDIWSADEGPPEWQALNEELDVRYRELIGIRLRGFGEHALAAMAEQDSGGELFTALQKKAERARIANAQLPRRPLPPS